MSEHSPLVIAIELVLIGLVVYWVINFLEGTRGERLFRGVLFILIAGVLILKIVSDRFGLTRLEYLYQYFLIFVLVIAVAAFQPEIRRALIRIAQPKFLTHSSQQLAHTAEELIDAARDLSATKTGGIIVLERKVALGEFIDTGVAIDATVTSDLLKTIFYTGSALHDMAVVIRGDRIVAARVQLPLAEADSLGGVSLGSRHRAAIGITNGSDAVCLVVSEETGIISVAENGDLTRNMTEAQLRARLSSSMGEITPIFERIRHRIPGKQKTRQSESVKKTDDQDTFL